MISRPLLLFALLGVPALSLVAARGSEVATRPVADGGPVVIFRAADRYTTFPDVKRLPDGRLVCVFRDASFPERVRHIEADARIVSSRSSDEGRSWSAPVVVYDDASCQNDPSVAVLRDGRLALTYFNWDGVSADYVAEHKPPLARRVDRGAWGAFALPGGVHLLWGRSTPVRWQSRARHMAGTARELRATSSSMLETRRGTLLLPIYGRTPERSVDRAYVLRSTDGGKTWSEEILLAADPAGKVAMQEPALCETAEGHIVALLRTAHADDHLYTTLSTDDGVTWDPPRPTPLVGHPADLQPLPDGRVFLAYGYRHDPFGVRACVSDDGGRTWDPAREIVITDRGAHTDLGYPSVCLTGDGHLLVAYYMNGPDTKDRWIECKRIPVARLR